MRSIFLHIFVWTCFISFLVPEVSAHKYTPESDDPVVRDGSLRLNCCFTYAPNSSDIREHLNQNADELQKLDAFIRSALNDKQTSVKRIRLSGYCSIDGDYMDNMLLARERAWSFREYLTDRYPRLHRYPIDVAWISEDWEKLKNMLRESQSSDKNELLSIITHIDSPAERKKRLISLRDGAPYEWMKEELFPFMRRVEVIIDFQAADSGADPVQENNEIPPKQEYFIDPLIYNVLDKKNQIQVPKSIFPRIYPWEEKTSASVYDYTPRWAVRTNLLLWAGVMPDAKRTTFTPNLSLEYYLTEHWSIEAGMQYSNWHHDNDRRFYGLTGYRLEPRYRFVLPALHNRFEAYIGLYGQVGDYNRTAAGFSSLSFGEDWGEAVGQIAGEAYTGRYWDAGLSAGLYVNLTKHWGIEIGARGGYVQTKSKLYTVEDGHRYLEKHQPYNKVKVTGLMLNLVYRWR